MLSPLAGVWLTVALVLVADLVSKRLLSGHELAALFHLGPLGLALADYPNGRTTFLSLPVSLVASPASLLIFLSLFVASLRNAALSWPLALCLGIGFGGVLGNLGEGLARGMVTDWLRLDLDGRPYLATNLADLAIIGGTLGFFLIGGWPSGRRLWARLIRAPVER
jgi:lipoprotein signal peptidase